MVFLPLVSTQLRSCCQELRSCPWHSRTRLELSCALALGQQGRVTTSTVMESAAELVRVTRAARFCRQVRFSAQSSANPEAEPPRAFVNPVVLAIATKGAPSSLSRHLRIRLLNLDRIDSYNATELKQTRSSSWSCRTAEVPALRRSPRTRPRPRQAEPPPPLRAPSRRSHRPTPSAPAEPIFSLRRIT